MEVASTGEAPQCVVDESGTKGGVNRDYSNAITLATVVQVEANALRILHGEIDLRQDWYALMLNFEGTVALIDGETDRIHLLPPRSVAVFRPQCVRYSYGRGRHRYTFIEWPDRNAPVLTRWIESQPVDGRSTYVIPLDPHFTDADLRLQEILSRPDCADPRLIGLMNEIVPLVMSLPETINLAPLPTDLPPAIASLAERVYARPQQPWPLKDAAELAGYSPFHFSRVFKSLVGYGFHEFVERTRTQVAVTSLLESDASIDSVAAAAGFGTTQGFRESMKEYLGVVPSELRTVVESR